MQKVGRRRGAPHPLITGRKTGNRRRTTNKQRSDVLRGLSRRQHAFIREKLFGATDKAAALLAGYSLSVAENTKQKIWAKPRVWEEYESLRQRLHSSPAANAAEPA
jgi:hypothetical protein